jgi:acyl CoA:acetate/3-ketoacid CoA transferase
VADPIDDANKKAESLVEMTQVKNEKKEGEEPGEDKEKTAQNAREKGGQVEVQVGKVLEDEPAQASLAPGKMDDLLNSPKKTKQMEEIYSPAVNTRLSRSNELIAGG